ncbi:uncharacterized protein PHACADRAFT_29583 [Phanerochaete carnosa HHB-10118-sp]|uniref:Uncharacterized protein n=1 Tax=Phanerochaete carnosa (strain HHB-10118-sp) TaxID=650164 RepID=K5UWF7_PHACS|nr:uncharacterized protein PHACADRAFT_29583 [Phanerochaete carnosa HHB-10118-sp]EKM54361.1 hypothetical protein PHACADRAFT_29583 [Phanerochaete carnosa HHB-10118-sp]
MANLDCFTHAVLAREVSNAEEYKVHKVRQHEEDDTEVSEVIIALQALYDYESNNKMKGWNTIACSDACGHMHSLSSLVVQMFMFDLLNSLPHLCLSDNHLKTLLNKFYSMSPITTLCLDWTNSLVQLHIHLFAEIASVSVNTIRLNAFKMKTLIFYSSFRLQDGCLVISLKWLCKLKHDSSTEIYCADVYILEQEAGISLLKLAKMCCLSLLVESAAYF